MRCRGMGWIGCVISAMIVGCGETKARNPSVAAGVVPATTGQDQAPLTVPNTEPAAETSSAAAEEAFARLLEATQGSDPDAWTAAENTLKELGVEAVPTLARQLGRDDPMARELAVQFLAILGPEAVGADDALVKALGDDSPTVRVNAAAALLAMNVSAKEAVAALKGMLEDDNPSVRLPAAISLAGMPATSAEAIPVLTELLTADEPTIRLTAVETLGRLGKKAESSLTAVRRLESDADADVRTAAAEAVQEIETAGAASSETIPASGVER